MNHEDPFKSYLKRNLPEAPENSFLEHRIWNAIQSDAKKERSWIHWLSPSHAAAAAGAVFALFLITLNQPSQTADSPRVAASPGSAIEEDFLEGFAGLSTESDEAEEISRFYETI